MSSSTSARNHDRQAHALESRLVAVQNQLRQIREEGATDEVVKWRQLANLARIDAADKSAEIKRLKKELKKATEDDDGGAA